MLKVVDFQGILQTVGWLERRRLNTRSTPKLVPETIHFGLSSDFHDFRSDLGSDVVMTLLRSCISFPWVNESLHIKFESI